MIADPETTFQVGAGTYEAFIFQDDIPFDKGAALYPYSAARANIVADFCLT